MVRTLTHVQKTPTLLATLLFDICSPLCTRRTSFPQDRRNVKTLLLHKTAPKFGHRINGTPVSFLDVIPDGLSSSLVVSKI